MKNGLKRRSTCSTTTGKKEHAAEIESKTINTAALILDLMMSSRSAVTVHLVIRPGADLLGVGSGSGGAARRSSRFRCRCGQGERPSVNWKPQQQLSWESTTFNPGSNEIILTGQEGRSILQGSSEVNVNMAAGRIVTMFA